MYNGIQMGMDGPMMAGTWVNPKTGHKFTVRDCFFENNEFKVQTTDGQILDYNTIQDYIQATTEAGTEDVKATNEISKNQPTNDIPQEVMDLMTDEDKMTGLGNMYAAQQPVAPDPVNVVQTAASTTQQEIDPDMVMVQRVLKRHPEPEIEASINWQVPQKQIETLVDVLGIEPETIADYYVQKLDKDAIFEYIKSTLTQHINSLVVPVPEVILAPVEDTTPRIPKSKKKTNKK